MLTISIPRVLTLCMILIPLVFPQNCHTEFIPVSLQGSEIPKQVQGKVRDDHKITILEDRRYFDVLLNKINTAKKDILISMYIFKTTGRKESTANKIKEALIKAAKRGVHVKVLLELEGGRSSTLNKENRHTADGLTKGGVKVYFDSPRQRTHVKAVVIDNRYTFIGSHNLTTSALGYNNELSLMMDSAEVARETARYVEEIIGKGEKKKQEVRSQK